MKEITEIHKDIKTEYYYNDNLIASVYINKNGDPQLDIISNEDFAKIILLGHV